MSEVSRASRGVTLLNYLRIPLRRGQCRRSLRLGAWSICRELWLVLDRGNLGECASGNFRDTSRQMLVQSAHKLALASLLIAASGCFAPTRADRFEAAFTESLQLCEEMRQSKGAYAPALDAKREEIDRIFDNPEGESYLEFEFNNQVDDEAAACVQGMLQRVRAEET